MIHEHSPRRDGPFIAVNCAAIAEPLLESELFGHARGSFTGATHDRAGFFEAADGGTLLLDEIGDVSPAMQAKLLRTLQEREVRRIGENRNRKIDVRVIAASHRDLAEEVTAGRFRQDLYYRLKIIDLHAPALRDRKEDILPLARMFVTAASRRMKRPVLGLSVRAADQLLRYQWPGNVRELENVIERTVALASARRIDVEDLPQEIQRALSSHVAVDTVRRLDEVEQDYILSVFALNDKNQQKTAKQLGIGTATLYRKLKRYGALGSR